MTKQHKCINCGSCFRCKDSWDGGPYKAKVEKLGFCLYYTTHSGVPRHMRQVGFCVRCATTETIKEEIRWKKLDGFEWPATPPPRPCGCNICRQQG